MFEWWEERWVIAIALILVGIILLDEVAYHHWKKVNPGHMYSHLRDKIITPLDPSRPPTIYYE